MPYIKKERRGLYNSYIKNITNQITPTYNPRKTLNSDMTYVIYKMIVDVYRGLDWDRMADALKVLEDVKLEFFKRVLTPHADKKIIENGDI